MDRVLAWMASCRGFKSLSLLEIFCTLYILVNIYNIHLFCEVCVVVGEHSICAEAGSVRTCGAYGRENVGMSNRNPDENSGPQKSKVSSAMEVSGG